MRGWLLLALSLGSFLVSAAETLRVGTSGDYAPFSVADEPLQDWPSGLSGFDIAVIEAYAKSRGLIIEWRQFHWPELLNALQSEQFDIAVGGITVRPERSVAGTYTLPLTQSGAVLLARKSHDNIAALDQTGAVVAVNAGGHLEQVARKLLQHATVRSIANNHQVLAQLNDPAVVAVMTDTGEAPYWLEQRPGLVQIGPLTTDRKAWLVQADQAQRIEDLNHWLLERERDGSLAQWRRQYLGDHAAQQTALPITALLAAVDERLALMPWVAAEKQRLELPIEDKPREQKVIASALANAAKPGQLHTEQEQAIVQFFRIQIEAAKDIQRRAIEQGTVPEPGPDLQEELRPALIRIGARISRLLAIMDAATPTPSQRQLAMQLNAAELLSPGLADGIVDSLIELSEPQPEVD